MTEIDDLPDYIEIYNGGASTVFLNNWFFLVSASQGTTPTRIAPFGGLAPSVPAGGYHVFGESAAQPSELPSGVGYTNLGALGFSLPLTSSPYVLALHDHLGRVVDLIRVSGLDDQVVHNAPRTPSFHGDFKGAALRQGLIGGSSIGRRIGSFGYITSNSGSAWQPCFTRTMGGVNLDFAGTQGLDSLLDVRMHESPLGEDLRLILNAGSFSSGRLYSFFFSLGHQNGTGPFFGLGFDALFNWQLVLSSPPFSGSLDAAGSARVDLSAGTLPVGFDLDAIFILQEPTGAFVTRTAILEFDT
jgi:hypothetical protein